MFFKKNPFEIFDEYLEKVIVDGLCKAIFGIILFVLTFAWLFNGYILSRMVMTASEKEAEITLKGELLDMLMLLAFAVFLLAAVLYIVNVAYKKIPFFKEICDRIEKRFF